MIAFFNSLAALFASNPLDAFVTLFLSGGWVVIAMTPLVGWYLYRLNTRRRKYEDAVPYILLALDVPKDIEPNLKAVEQIFAHLSGIKNSRTFWEKYWKGEIQETLSFEIVSIDGYIQFLIRTPDYYRDMVEAAIYAQYPEAQITQVDDYTEGMPTVFPDTDYELWGTEFKFTNKDAYPIRTYLSFEYGLTQTLADPMASILEILSRIQRGEQVWLQFVMIPAESAWRKKAEALVRKLIGEKGGDSNALESALYWPRTIGKGIWESATENILGTTQDNTQSTKDEEPSKIRYLSPGAIDVVKQIQMKLTKTAFRTAFRFIYLAPKELYSKPRVVSGVLGAIQQFSVEDMNSIVKSKYYTTKAPTVRGPARLAFRQRRIMRRFRKRVSPELGNMGMVLNTEELASLYHFPTETVKAPLVKKSEARRGEPPVGLPTERSASISQTREPIPQDEKAPSGPPENLPL